MDVATLQKTLTDARQADGSLDLTGQLVESDAIGALLAAYFDHGKVHIAGSSVTRSADGASVVVAGALDFGNLPRCAAEATLTPAGTDVFLALTIAPAGGWTLSQAFPRMPATLVGPLVFTEASLVVASGPWSVPGRNASVARGMSLLGSLDMRQSYGYLGPILGGRTSLAITGPITNPNLPLLSLQTESPPVSLGSTPLTGAGFTFALVNLFPDDPTPIATGVATLTASLDLDGKGTGAVSVSLPLNAGAISLNVAFQGVSLADFTSLARFIGSAALAGALPQEIQDALQQAGSALLLQQLGLQFDLARAGFLSARVEVGVDLKGFGLFAPLPALAVDDLVFSWQVDNTGATPGVEFRAAAQIAIDKCPVTVAFQTEATGDYLIYIAQNAGDVFHLSDVVANFLPGMTYLPQLDVENLSLTLAPRLNQYWFTATVIGSWSVLAELGIELAAVEISATYWGSQNPALSGSLAGLLTLEVDAAPSAVGAADDGDNPPNQIDLYMRATRLAGSDGWQLQGYTGQDQIVPVGDLITALVKKFGTSANVPAAIADLTIENLSLDFDTVNKEFRFACAINLAVASAQIELVVNVDVTKAAGSYDTGFGGVIIVNNLEFDIVFESRGSQSRSFLAVYSPKNGDPLHVTLQSLVGAISQDLAQAVPGDIDIELQDVKLVFVRQEQISDFAFGLDLGLSLALSDLPVVGTMLPAGIALAIEDLQATYSSIAMTADQVGDINALLPAEAVPFPPAGLASGINLLASFRLAAASQQVILAVPGQQQAQQQEEQQQPQPGAGARGGGATAPAIPAASGTTKWFQVGKTAGPIAIARVGVQYQSGALFFLLDASLNFGAFQLGLDGLGLGSPLTKFEPSFHLDGISVSLGAGPVKVGGGMLVVPPPLPADVTEDYIGEVTVAVEPYLISGVAGYAKVDGAPSFFAFAQIEGEFGGPPAFFVTGFMGGFGYNSQLALPPPDQVYRFPFIAGLDDPNLFGSASPTPLDVMNVLSGGGGKPAWVTPILGEDWIAAGIMFRSFELVLGHALLAVTFGKEFEIALLGLAGMSLPQGATTEAYAYVELQLEAVLKPTQGSFVAAASLTPNSFVLTRSCHLTGGFAFCLWFGGNPHAGDFVVTIGGYHPAFVPHDWYPKPVPVGFNWPVDSNVTVKGGAYFAVTPTAAMAGGGLQVLYQSGDLRAWFTACANLIVRWKPFYFTATIGVSVGASYRVNMDYTTVTETVELAASLTLWGPPTGGTVYVDWSVISFTVDFGAARGSGAAATLDWAGFQSLLPAGRPAAARASRHGPMAARPGAAAAPSAVLGVHVNGGLVQQSQSDGTWTVRSDAFAFSTQSAIPASELSAGGRAVPLASGAPSAIDIRPMGLAEVRATHAVTICRADNTELDLSGWPEPVVLTGNLPEALWGKPLAGGSPPPPTAATVPNLPVGMRLAAPPASAGNAVGPVDPANLVTPLGGGSLPFASGNQNDSTAPPQVGDGSIAQIAETIASPAALQAQAAILAGLNTFAAAPPTAAALTALGQQAGRLFAQPPLLAA